MESHHNPFTPRLLLTSNYLSSPPKLIGSLIVMTGMMYAINSSCSAWGIVSTWVSHFAICWDRLTFELHKKQKILVLNVVQLHATYGICPNFPSSDTAFRSKTSQTHANIRAIIIANFAISHRGRKQPFSFINKNNIQMWFSPPCCIQSSIRWKKRYSAECGEIKRNPWGSLLYPLGRQNNKQTFTKQHPLVSVSVVMTKAASSQCWQSTPTVCTHILVFIHVDV